MQNKEELKLAIEKARKELDTVIEAGELDKIYEKSQKLDKLIEIYIDGNTDYV